MSYPHNNKRIQDVYLDYCPVRKSNETFEKAYETYFDEENALGCSHLSALHFPNGGAFSYIEGDIFSLNKCIKESLRKEFNETTFFQTLRRCNFFFFFFFFIYQYKLSPERTSFQKRQIPNPWM